MRLLFGLPTTPIRYGDWDLIVFTLTICPQLDRIRQTVRLGTKSGVSDAAPDIIIILEDDKVVHGCIGQGLLAKRGTVRRSISRGCRMQGLTPSQGIFRIAQTYSGRNTSCASATARQQRQETDD